MTSSATRRRLLVIDDDQLLCTAIHAILQNEPVEILTAHTGLEGIEICRRYPVDIVLLDRKLPDGKGQLFFPEILKHNDQAKIIFISAYPSFDSAVQGIKLGIFDYLAKPFSYNELRLTVNQAVRTLELEQVAQIQDYDRKKDQLATDLIGAAGGLKETATLIQLAAGSEAPVIITGETGTGKNIAAKSIHYTGPNPRAPLLAINCAALPENLIESELFGYEKGAFTGATSTRKGIFEMANGGTLILDEIGEMPIHLQSKLLGVLEDGQVMRLGSSTVRSVQVRVIAVTNINMEEAVQQKLFRSDLYFRLNVIRIHLPPLRKRKEDIPTLADYFIARATHGKAMHLPRQAMGQLLDYNWPGNVRELKNVLERAVALQKEALLNRPDSLGPLLPTQPLITPDTLAPENPITLATLERRHIQHTLAHYSGNLSRSAENLGIALSTLKRKIKSYTT